MTDIMNENEKDGRKSFKAPIATASAISTYFSFSGFNLMAETASQKFNAGLFALLAGLGVYILWTLSLKFVPRQKTPITRVIAWIIVMLGMGMIFCVSSLTNMMAFRGLEAMEHDLRVEIIKMATVLDERYQHGLSLSSLATDLRGDAGQFQAYADEENLKGTYSGFAGSGAVHKSFVTISYRLNNLVEETENFTHANEARYNAVSVGLAEIRRISLLKLPLKERTRQIEMKADEIYKHLADMDPRYVAASISRTAKALPREIDFRVTYSRNKTIAKTQKLALERAADDVQQVSDKLVYTADEIAQSDTIPLSRFEAKSPAKAVITHADNYIGFWVAALCADGLPVFIVIFYSLYYYRKTDEELAHDNMLSVTTKDIIMARLAQDATRLGHLDQQSSNYITGTVLGRNEQGE